MAKLSRGLKPLPGIRSKAQRAEDAIGSIAKLKEAPDQQPPRLLEIERLVKNRPQAKRLYDLEQQYPLSTLPELVAVDWLQRKSIPHLYQVGLLGGRQSRGGLVPDLVVLQGGPSVWQIQGNYWHQRAGAKTRDAAVRQLLLGSAVNGRQVQRVVEIWERRLLADAEAVLNSALMGIEEGP